MPRLAEDPFKVLSNEKRVPVKIEGMEFTRKWFIHRNQTTWSTFLLPRYGKSKTPLSMIQIGVFEGMDLVWCFQNILTHPLTRVLAIDPWAETSKISKDEMEKVYGRARSNLAQWEDQIVFKRGLSKDVLEKVRVDGSFDLIVIDGDHTAEAVLEDARHALRLLKPGGWMVFDDVRNRIPKPDHVIHGIEKFLGESGSRVTLMWKHRFCDCYAKN